MNMARIALIVVTLIGMRLCGAGVGKVAAHHDWLHPLALVSMTIGVVALFIPAAVFLNVGLPFITSDSIAIAAVITVVIVKVALTQIHGLV
jgi:hypothetical protein